MAALKVDLSLGRELTFVLKLLLLFFGHKLPVVFVGVNLALNASHFGLGNQSLGGLHLETFL
jgi:hypothetical protein